MSEELKIVIDETVYKKIMFWVRKAGTDEVSGLGKVTFDVEANCFRVVEAFILPQRNTGGSTDIEPEAISKLMFKTKDTPGDLRWWWHSHANMGVFWSGTDKTTIKQLGGGGWFTATVFNNKEEAKSAYCQVDPIPLVFEDLKTSVDRSVDAATAKQWEDEYSENVKKHTWSSYAAAYGAEYGGGRAATPGFVYQGKKSDWTEEEKQAYFAELEASTQAKFEDYKNNRRGNVVPVEKKNSQKAGQLELNPETGELTWEDLKQLMNEAASMETEAKSAEDNGTVKDADAEDDGKLTNEQKTTRDFWKRLM